MAYANLNISITEKRLLSLSEAAIYAGLPVKYFKTLCPVQPLELRAGTESWDKRDLDRWIDDMKEGAEIATQESILSKL